MPHVVGPIDQNIPIDINISGMTPHVFAYKLWWRDDANATWSAIGEGSTGDQAPDFYQHAFAKGGQLYHWVGIAGQPNSRYDGIVTVGQSGRVMPNGLVHITGTANDKGVDVQQDWINFL
jgi:hypothetical protein